ncbi:MAG: GNAT family N-acetyltransferase [Meiothermus sp.]
MIRPLAQKDLPQLVDLLTWMDQDASRGVLSPESRSPEGLYWEVLALGGEADWEALVVEEDGQLLGYAALYPFWEGGALEGPLVRGPEGKKLLEKIIARAKARGYPTLHAFPQESNRPLRRMLEEAGFAAQHTTYFFAIPRTDLTYPPPSDVRIVVDEPPDPETYRKLYQACEDNWAQRLSWSDDDLLEHFEDNEVTLLVAYRLADGALHEPLGMVELERDDDWAEVAYIGVIPERRGQGIGRALLGAAANLAFADPQVQKLRVRAHDHEKAAMELYRRLGFQLEEAVVTYALDLDQA